MSVYDAPKSSYSETTQAVRIISDVINLIDPVDTPLLTALGGIDSARSKFRIRGNGTKIEWIEDTYAVLSGNLTAATITSTTTVLPVVDGSIFKSGQVVKIDSEYMWVSSVSGDNVTVSSRTYGGTQATHATSATVEIVGMARLEGADASFDAFVNISQPYNYTSIFQKGLKVTGTEMVVDEYGYNDVWAYQANKSMPEMFRLIEKQIFNGIRGVGSATTPRSFGGLGTFVGNSTTATTHITKTAIDNLAEYIYLDGGMPDLIVMHPTEANVLHGLLDTSSFIRIDQSNDQFGMAPVKMISTQYGDFKLIIDRFCPAKSVYMLDSRKVGLYSLRPFGWRELGYTGDFKSAELVGELSLVVANGDAHGVVTIS